MLASPWRNVNSRTRSPTVTASSTSADMIRGVETATSTPHASLNSHSFFGWLTRATVRGTRELGLGQQRDDQVDLVVAGGGDRRRRSAAEPASSSEDSSQASASSHSASGTLSALIARGSLSMSRTSWPFSSSSRGDRPADAPAPAMATRISCSSGPAAMAAFDRVGLAVGASPGARGRRPGGPCRAGPACPRRAGSGTRPGRRCPRARSACGRSSSPGASTTSIRIAAGRVAPLRLGALGQQPAQHLVGRPAHGGDGGDAQPLVDLGAARVVDPGHHVVDAERLAGHPGGDDVGVVAAADRGEGLGRARCRPPRARSRSKPMPVTLPPAKLGPEPAEGVRAGRSRPPCGRAPPGCAPASSRPGRSP